MMHASPVARRAFTLVELLVVLSIIAVLMAIVSPMLFRSQGAAKRAKANTQIVAFKQELETFNGHYGQYPPTSFAKLKATKSSGGNYPWKDMTAPTNGVNDGIECMVICLSTAQGGVEPHEWKDEDLGNTDSDTVSGIAKFTFKEAFEALDPWGNPYVYIGRDGYSAKHRFQLGPDRGGTVYEVSAQTSEKQGSFRNPRSFQLFSLGEDGDPGTSDDIGLE